MARLAASRGLTISSSQSNSPAHGQQAEQPCGPDNNVRKLRQVRRRDYVVPAEISIGNQTFLVTTCDISRTGIGFTGATGIPCGQAVTIELLGGRHLSGVVNWTRNGRGGIEFDQPLASDDPLIQSGSEASQQTEEVALCGNSKLARRTPPTPLVTALGKLVGGAAGYIAAWCSRGSEVHRDRKERRMIERLCRKQGYAWLVEEPTTANQSSAGGRVLEAKKSPN